MSKTKLNAIALYANFIVMALVGLLINPILVHSLGAADFGIWKACLRLLDLSGVADGRATQALKWVVAHGSTKSDKAELRRAIATSAIIWILWLPVLLLAVSAMIYFLPLLIKGIAIDQLVVARLTALTLGANVIVSAIIGIPDAVLIGTNQGYRSTVLTTAFLVASNLAMLFAAQAGYGLPALALITLASTITNGLFAWLVARQRVPWWGIAKPARSDIARFAGFSNWTLGWALVQLLLLSSELLLIGALSGPVTVTKYTFTSYAVQFALSICLMTGSAVTPRLGALVGARDSREATVLVSQAREILFAIMAVSGGGILLLNRAFVSTWVGPEYYMGDTINALMVIAFLQLAMIRFDAQIQDTGLNIAKKVLMGAAGTLASLLMAGLLYMIFLSVESLYVGVILGRLPIVFYFPRLVATMMPELRHSWQRLIVMGLIVGICALLAPFMNLHGWFNFAACSLAAALILGFTACYLILSTQTRHRLIAVSLRVPRQASS